MRGGHTELSERANFLVGGQTRGAALHNPVDHMAGVALAFKYGRIDSAAGEKLRLARRNRVSMGDKRISKSGLTRTLRHMELCVVPLAALRLKHASNVFVIAALAKTFAFPEYATPILDERRHKRQAARLAGASWAFAFLRGLGFMFLPP
jgi:hypothetical protein